MGNELLAVCGHFGCYVFATVTGKRLHHVVPTRNDYVNNAAIHNHWLCVTCDVPPNLNATPIISRPQRRIAEKVLLCPLAPVCLTYAQGS